MDTGNKLISSGEKSYKYFIGYMNDDYEITLLNNASKN